MPDASVTASQGAAVAPRTVEALRSAIADKYPDLSRRMREVAAFILEKAETVAFDSLVDISERSGISPASMVRFAKILGYGGASQMQKLIRSELLSSRVALSYQQRIRRFHLRGEAVPNVLDEWVQADLASLLQLRRSFDRQKIRAGGAQIHNADVVYVAGFRRMYAAAAHMAITLQSIGKNARLVEGTAGFWQNQIRNITVRDLLIIISFYPYAAEAERCHSTAVECGASILSITDSNVSPFARGRAQSFLIQEAEVRSFRSLTATLSLVQSLAAECASFADRPCP